MRALLGLSCASAPLPVLCGAGHGRWRSPVWSPCASGCALSSSVGPLSARSAASSASAPARHRSASRCRWDSGCCFPPPWCPPAACVLESHGALAPSPDPVVQFADGLGPNRLPQTQQRLFIRHFRQANPAETPVHHVGSYFPLYNLVTPIAHVLQDQHAQRYFGWRLPSPARAAPPMPFPLRLVDGCQQFVVLQ